MVKKQHQRNFITVIFLVVTFFSCNTDDQCNSNILSLKGDYYNYFEEDVLNYIKVLPNNTYQHIYQKDSIKIIDTGNWLITDSINCKVAFKNWRMLGSIKDTCVCKYTCTWIVEISNEELSV